ncbi:MAG: M48 family metallopeptidase [Eubacteriales bacterium]|nr:M48 family metallopeptidase [Eubacteriales bacterium]
MTDYRIIRSGRRTIGLSMTDEGLVVRAPYRASQGSIEKFIRENGSWIAKAAKRQSKTMALAMDQGPITAQEIASLTARAKAIIPERVFYYARIMGVNPGRITIRCQKSKWGSCSGKGNLNFNCLLLMAPMEVMDAILVHELCHLKEMNHSPQFYKEVLQVYPEYRRWHRWLKDNGEVLMKRVWAVNC